MALRLRMSAELGDWLAELCTFEPASAAEVGAALLAAMKAADLESLPVVGQPSSVPPDPREVVDYAYQQMLEALQTLRRNVADLTTDRKHWADEVADAEAGGRPDEVAAQLRGQLAEAERREQQVALRCQRIQREVDAFRTSKETAKAMYTAAEASLRVQEAIDAAAGISERSLAVVEAEAALRAVAAQAAENLRWGQQRTNAEPVDGLLELRADPLGRDVRLLLAVEPADTVTVLAVLDGEDAIAAHRAQAIELAGELLTDIRAGDWPPADPLGAGDLEVTFAAAATFLARFFPLAGDDIAERATALGQARTLAQLRHANGISLADLAVETGIDEKRLRLIEDGGLRAAQVHEAVAYVRALGGRLTLAVDGDTAQTVIG
jgi:hypothetical protein